MSQRISLDYDLYGNPQLRDMRELLALVKVDAMRIMHLLGPRAGKAVIKRSLNGYHLSFPWSRVTEEEVNWILEDSPADSGYKHWTRERGSSTLRIGSKTIMVMVGEWPRKRIVGSRRVEDQPYVVETMESKNLVGYR